MGMSNLKCKKCKRAFSILLITFCARVNKHTNANNNNITPNTNTRKREKTLLQQSTLMCNGPLSFRNYILFSVFLLLLLLLLPLVINGFNVSL